VLIQNGLYVVIQLAGIAIARASLNAIGSNVTGVQGDVVSLPDLDRLYEAHMNSLEVSSDSRFHRAS
jgi:hypothetical protein